MKASGGASGTTIYWRDQKGQVLSETDQSGSVNNNYIYMNGQAVAWIDIGHGAPTKYQYYLHDHLGTTRVITTSTGAVCYDADFFPWGGEQHLFTNTCSQNYKFTGKERDPDTNSTDYFGARWYLGGMARFYSPDPAGIMKQKLIDPQQWNMYSYVRNNPIRLTDPTGMYLTNCGSLNAKSCASKVKAIDSYVAKLAQSNNDRDKAIAKTLGTSQDTNNGVTISFVAAFKNAQGAVLTHKNGNTSGWFAAGQSTPDGKPVADIHIDLKGSLQDDDLDATVKHEGSHATDRMNFVSSCDARGCSQSFNLTGRQSEQGAFGAEYNFWQSVGKGDQHSTINSPEKIDELLNSHPDVYPRSMLDNPLFPSEL